jgi:sulfatase modifying factor 1
VNSTISILSLFQIFIIIACQVSFFLSCQASNPSIGLNSSDSECSKLIPRMSCIPEGEFIRGSNDFESNEKPESKIFISTFYMDQYEVTNLEFKKCLAAGKCQDCLKTGKCNKVYPPNYGRIYSGDNQPVVGVSWYSAKEYCEFVEKRLPTEAEWEKASRGTKGFIYPWGNTKATCAEAVIEEDGKKGCWDKKISPPYHMTTRNIGTKPPNGYGLYDMAGNSWEWVADWYSPSYKDCGTECTVKNPQGACSGMDSCAKFDSKKIVKGGSWWWPSETSRASYRRAHIPRNSPEYHHFGFRCAKDAL